MGPSKPNSAKKISLIYPRLWSCPWRNLLELSQKHFHVLSFRAVEEVALPDLAELLSKSTQLVTETGRSLAVIIEGGNQLDRSRVTFCSHRSYQRTWC